MIRIILYLVGIAIIGAFFAFIANNNHDIQFLFGQNRVVISPFVAAGFTAILALLALTIWWVLSRLVQFPRSIMTTLAQNAQEKQQNLIEHGVLALLSHDKQALKDVSKKLGSLDKQRHNKLAYVIKAQQNINADAPKNAAAIYEELLKDEATRPLSLYKLYVLAKKAKDEEQAINLARQAFEENNALSWAQNSLLTHEVAAGDFEAAYSLLDKGEKAASRGAGENFKHKRMIVQLAQASALEALQPFEARGLALKAYKLNNGFIPAINIAAKMLYQGDEDHKASRMIEAQWARLPHPDLAHTYMAKTANQSPKQRLKRARLLGAINPKHFYSYMLMAQYGFEAGALDFARANAKAAIEAEPRRSAYLLLADIDQADGANLERVRNWLALGAHAPLDATWCDEHSPVDQWSAIGPFSHKLDSVIWSEPTKPAPKAPKK